jgi:predicted O-methyltransferase YrrM
MRSKRNTGLQLAYKYLIHFIRSRKHQEVPKDIDDFLTFLDPKIAYYSFEEIEQLRETMLNDNNKLFFEDYGAGSRVDNKRYRKISSIANNAGVQPKFGELLFKTVNHFKSKDILELGTSLGLSAMYLASVSKSSSVITIEGCESIFNYAVGVFEDLKKENINVIHGKFDDVLPDLLNINSYDLIHVDGNHQYQATIDYFNMFLTHSKPNTIIIFDDIYWSKGMEAAWSEIKKHKSVTLSIDFFFKGMIFMDSKWSKQDLYFNL